MILTYSIKKSLRKWIAVLVLCAFTLTTGVCFPGPSFAQTVLNLPQPGAMVNLTPAFTPALLKGLKVYADNPFKFDFIIDTGDSKLQGAALKSESEKLIKYFLAALTVPEESLWVNLSPYEKDRIVPQELGITDMGRDLLAQDYILKQLTASLIYPEEDLGKEFWQKVYNKAVKTFGSTKIPINTFNKVWIIPDGAKIYENSDRVFVVNSHLKVMLDEDYLAMQQNLGNKNLGAGQLSNEAAAKSSDISSSIVRETILPAIEKEVNEGKNFTLLRQIYNSVILATWYKRNLQTSILNKVYVDQNKVIGIDLRDRDVKQKIYSQYLEAFKKGVYNYIREDYDPGEQKIIPRKYFSGGTNLREIKFDTDARPEDAVPVGEVVNVEGGMQIAPRGIDTGGNTGLDAAMLGSVMAGWNYENIYFNPESRALFLLGAVRPLGESGAVEEGDEEFFADGKGVAREIILQTRGLDNGEKQKIAAIQQELKIQDVPLRLILRNETAVKHRIHGTVTGGQIFLREDILSDGNPPEIREAMAYLTKGLTSAAGRPEQPSGILQQFMTKLSDRDKSDRVTSADLWVVPELKEMERFLSDDRGTASMVMLGDVWIEAGSAAYRVWADGARKVWFQRHDRIRGEAKGRVHPVNEDVLFNVGSSREEGGNTYVVDDPELAPQHFSLQVTRVDDQQVITIRNRDLTQIKWETGSPYGRLDEVLVHKNLQKIESGLANPDNIATYEASPGRTLPVGFTVRYNLVTGEIREILNPDLPRLDQEGIGETFVVIRTRGDLQLGLDEPYPANFENAIEVYNAQRRAKLAAQGTPQAPEEPGQEKAQDSAMLGVKPARFDPTNWQKDVRDILQSGELSQPDWLGELNDRIVADYNAGQPLPVIRLQRDVDVIAGIDSVRQNMSELMDRLKVGGLAEVPAGKYVYLTVLDTKRRRDFQGNANIEGYTYQTIVLKNERAVLESAVYSWLGINQVAASPGGNILFLNQMSIRVNAEGEPAVTNDTIALNNSLRGSRIITNRVYPNLVNFLRRYFGGGIIEGEIVHPAVLEIFKRYFNDLQAKNPADKNRTPQYGWPVEWTGRIPLAPAEPVTSGRTGVPAGIVALAKELDKVPEWPRLTPSRIDAQFDQDMQQYVSALQGHLLRLSTGRSVADNRTVPLEQAKGLQDFLSGLAVSLGIFPEFDRLDREARRGMPQAQDWTLNDWKAYVQAVLFRLNRLSFIDRGWLLDVGSVKDGHLILRKARVQSFNTYEVAGKPEITALISEDTGPGVLLEERFLPEAEAIYLPPGYQLFNAEQFSTDTLQAARAKLLEYARDERVKSRLPNTSRVLARLEGISEGRFGEILRYLVSLEESSHSADFRLVQQADAEIPGLTMEEKVAIIFSQEPENPIVETVKKYFMRLARRPDISSSKENISKLLKLVVEARADLRMLLRARDADELAVALAVVIRDTGGLSLITPDVGVYPINLISSRITALALEGGLTGKLASVDLGQTQDSYEFPEIARREPARLLDEIRRITTVIDVSGTVLSSGTDSAMLGKVKGSTLRRLGLATAVAAGIGGGFWAWNLRERDVERLVPDKISPPVPTVTAPPAEEKPQLKIDFEDMRNTRLRQAIPGYAVMTVDEKLQQHFTLEDIAQEIQNLPSPAGPFQFYRLYKGNIYFTYFAALNEQDKMYDRLALFAEVEGYRGKILSDREIADARTKLGKAHIYGGHDYDVYTMAGFFTSAAMSGVRLNDYERQLENFLLEGGFMVETSPGVYEAKDNMALLSFPASTGAAGRSTITAPDGKRITLVEVPRPDIFGRTPSPAISEDEFSIITHELNHGLYFTNMQYRMAVDTVWRQNLNDQERETVKAFLAAHGYDTADEDLVKREFAAHFRDFDALMAMQKSDYLKYNKGEAPKEKAEQFKKMIAETMISSSGYFYYFQYEVLKQAIDDQDPWKFTEGKVADIAEGGNLLAQGGIKTVFMDPEFIQSVRLMQAALRHIEDFSDKGPYQGNEIKPIPKFELVNPLEREVRVVHSIIPQGIGIITTMFTTLQVNMAVEGLDQWISEQPPKVQEKLREELAKFKAKNLDARHAEFSYNVVPNQWTMAEDHFHMKQLPDVVNVSAKPIGRYEERSDKTVVWWNTVKDKTAPAGWPQIQSTHGGGTVESVETKMLPAWKEGEGGKLWVETWQAFRQAHPNLTPADELIIDHGTREGEVRVDANGDYWRAPPTEFLKFELYEKAPEQKAATPKELKQRVDDWGTKLPKLSPLGDTNRIRNSPTLKVRVKGSLEGLPAIPSLPSDAKGEDAVEPSFLRTDQLDKFDFKDFSPDSIIQPAKPLGAENQDNAMLGTLAKRGKDLGKDLKFVRAQSAPWERLTLQGKELPQVGGRSENRVYDLGDEVIRVRSMEYIEGDEKIQMILDLGQSGVAPLISAYGWVGNDRSGFPFTVARKIVGDTVDKKQIAGLSEADIQKIADLLDLMVEQKAKAFDFTPSNIMLGHAAGEKEERAYLLDYDTVASGDDQLSVAKELLSQLQMGGLWSLYDHQDRLIAHMKAKLKTMTGSAEDSAMLGVQPSVLTKQRLGTFLERFGAQSSVRKRIIKLLAATISPDFLRQDRAVSDTLERYLLGFSGTDLKQVEVVLQGYLQGHPDEVAIYKPVMDTLKFLAQGGSLGFNEAANIVLANNAGIGFILSDSVTGAEVKTYFNKDGQGTLNFGIIGEQESHSIVLWNAEDLGGEAKPVHVNVTATLDGFTIKNMRTGSELAYRDYAMLGKTDTRPETPDQSKSVVVTSDESRVTSDAEVGGINLNPSTIEMEKQGEGIKFDVPFDPQTIQNMTIDGLVPVIFSITPVTNLPLLLGVSPKPGGEQLSQLAR